MSLTANHSASAGRLSGRTRRRTAAQALVEYLQVQYAEFDGRRERLIPAVYGIFGHGQSVGLAQALAEYGSELPHIQGKNEQSMVHAAIGHAKATNRLSTFACTASAGPGSINMVTGAGTATSNRLPVLLLPADGITNHRADPILQQIEHPVDRDVTATDCFRPVSRFFDRLANAEQLLHSLPEAMRVLTDPVETGAATLALPQDIQGQAFDYPEVFFEPRVWQIVRRAAAEEQLQATLDLIRTCERPIIIAGGGVRYSGAQEVLARFSEEFGIPVGETYAGKGSGPISELNLGGIGVTGTIGADQIAANADAVIAIGTRLQDFITGSSSLFENPDVRAVGINVGSFDAHKIGALPVVGDAKLSIEWLHEALSSVGYATSDSYRAEIRQAGDATSTQLQTDLGPHPGEKVSQAEIVHALNKNTTADDALVVGSGGAVELIHKLWDTSNGTDIHFEYAFSCMGHEIPASIGYRIGRDDLDGEVFALIGDGTYLMQPTELVTAVQEHKKVIVVLLDNSGHQCIVGTQFAKTGVEFGTQLRERSVQTGRLDGDVVVVDFAANAASFGCASWTASTIEEFEQALTEARAADGPALIAVHVEPSRGLSPNGVFWDVGVPLASESEDTRARVSVHEEGRTKQRYLGATPAPESEN